MSAGIGYDTTAFQALQKDLEALNEAALADGLVAPRDGRIVTPNRVASTRGSAPGRSPKKLAAPASAEGRKPAADRSKAAASRLLAMLGRGAEDMSIEIAGTPFTGVGVAKLMMHLRRRRSRRIGPWLRFLQRAERYLSRPVSSGVRTIEGVGLERLQVFSRHLDEIAAGGWAQFQAARATRRSRLARTGTFTDQPDTVAPAAARRNGTSR